MEFFDNDRQIAITTAEMCLHSPQPEYLINSILSRGEIACIFGSPGAGKSLFALMLAYKISQGDLISGMKTEKGPVLYLAYEDFEGIVRRVHALHQRMGPTDNFFLLPEIGNLFEEDEDGNSYSINKIAKYAREKNISLIIIDTLSVAFAGVEENDHRSMGRIFERVKYIADWSGAAVILVHHGAKSEIGTPTPRGSGTFNAVLNLALHVRQTSSGRIEVRSTKVKNGSNDVCLKYNIQIESISADSNGEPITAAVCDESDTEGEARACSKAEFAALRILDELQQSGPVSEREWLSACTAGNRVSGAGQPADRIRVARRVIQNLKGHGLIATVDGCVSRSGE